MAWQSPTLPDPFFTGYQLRGSQTVGDKRKEKRINFMTTSFSLRSFTVKLSTFVVDNSVCLMVKSPQTHYRHWHGKVWLNFIQIWFHSLAWHSPPFFRTPIAFWCIFLKRWLMEWLNKKTPQNGLQGSIVHSATISRSQKWAYDFFSSSIHNQAYKINTASEVIHYFINDIKTTIYFNSLKSKWTRNL